MKKIFQISALLLTVFLGVISPIQATVSSEINRVNYTCNGTTTVYNYTFKIYEDNDVLVAKKDASGIQTNLILNSDYTVTGAGSASGTVVLTAGSKCASGYTLSLLRNVEFTQETDYVEGDTFPADSHETALDKITILAQQNAEELNRTLKVQESSTLTNLKVPVVANRVIGWDSAGTGITTYGTTVAQSAEIDTLENHGGSLNQAITDIGSGSQTLFCDSATNLTASVTIPATLHLVALQGCMITKTSTYTLAINGNFEAGLYQVFSGFASGNVTFAAGKVKEVYPVWWGGVGDGAADDTEALSSAIYAIKTNYGTVKIPLNTSYRITSQLDYSGITIRGTHRNHSKIFIDFAGIGLNASDGSNQSTLENLTIGGTLSFDWVNNPTAGKIGVRIVSSHNHLIKNCYFFALDTAIKITGGGYYGITEQNAFRRNNISIHLLSDGTGPPNEQKILFNQFDVYPVSVGGRGTTVGIRAEGIVAAGITGLHIIGNGLENIATAIEFMYTNNVTLISNRNENNGVNYTFDASGGILEIGTNTVPTIFSVLGATPLFKINTPTVQQEEPTGTVLYSFSRGGTIHASVGVNASNEAIVQANSVPLKFSADGFVTTHLHIDTAGNVGLAGTAGNDASPPVISDGPGVHIAGKILRIDSSKTPASASAPCNTGELSWDASYFYICIVTNTWHRSAHVTW